VRRTVTTTDTRPGADLNCTEGRAPSGGNPGGPTVVAARGPPRRCGRTDRARRASLA